VIVWEVWSRIVEFAGERSRHGTAFLVGSGDDQLLITARHLCTDEREEVLLLRHPWTNDGFAYQLTAGRVGMDVAPTADFAMFRMTKPIAVPADVPLTSDGFGFSQAAYILGYPFGLSSRPRSPVQRLPIVKGCVLAGTETTDDGVDLFYIDALVNPGFSGGPLVFIDPNTKQSKFAGVVAKGMFAPVREPTPEEPEPPEAPAGIGIVVKETTFRHAIQRA
jgi:S1-C subfamily serine protease